MPPAPPPTPPSDATLLARRPYKEYVPATLPAGPAPLIVVLAGYGGLSSDTAKYLGFTALADAQGILLALPNGSRDSNGVIAWFVGPTHSPHWDVEYLRAVIRDMESKHAVDPKQVFVAGHSQGGHMAYRMACDDAPDVTQIMVLAGQAPKEAVDCAVARPVAVVHVHGDEDEVIGYSGDIQNSPPDPTVPSAHESVATFASYDHCQGAIADAGVSYDFDKLLPGAETTVEAYSGCADNTGVELWTIHGGSHDPDFNASFAPTVWQFWMQHLRP